ncbi:hypothetical protein, partial [Pseudoflavonifractor capillosus]|uniref:hypothetical protein n=1 Tax=Pseudoflavonifractor capillosus TaxID=106588 RepID=UPI0019591A68
FCMPKTLRKFHILDSFLLLRVKKDVPQNLRFATHPFVLYKDYEKDIFRFPKEGFNLSQLAKSW